MNRQSLAIVCVFLFVLLLFATFGQRGIVHIYHLAKERDGIKTFNERIKRENRDLKEEIYSLKSDRRKIERIARRMGLVKKDEIIYHFENPKNVDMNAGKKEKYPYEKP